MVYKLRLWVSSWRQFRSQKKKKKKIDTSSLLSILVIDDPAAKM